MGPTAFAFVRGDAALAAKALATFRRETRLLEFKGGVMGADTLSAEDIDALSRLPALDVLRGSSSASWPRRSPASPAVWPA